MGRLRSLVGFLLIALVVTGCGSSGGDSPPAGTVNRGLSGTVAVGAAVSLGTVEVRDSLGAIKTTTTDDAGEYTIDLTGTTAPWILRVENPPLSGEYIYSYADQSGICNIHPLTDPIIRAWFSVNNQLMDDIDGVFDDSTAALVLPTATEIKVVKAVVTQVVNNLLTAAGVAADFDLFTSDFAANQTGFDKVLDGTTVTLTGTVINVGVKADSTLETTIAASGGVVSNATLDAGIIDFVTIDTTAPSAPAGLQAALVSDTQALLTWNANGSGEAVMGYNIYRGTTKVGTVTTTAFIAGGLAANTQYVFTVKAFDAAGNTSLASTGATVITPAPATVADTTAPTAPGTPGATTIALKQISLAWAPSTDVKGVVGYRVFRNNVKIATIPSGPVDINLAFIDYGLTPGTLYSYYIQAFDAAGNNANSSPVSLTTLSLVTAPTGLLASAVAGTIDSIAISWNAVAGATDYKVYRNGALINTVQVTSFTDTGLTAGTIYSYEVRAWVSLTNFSDPTVPLTATTIADTDGDGTGDDLDQCATDAAKTIPGACGCGTADTDTDGDLTADCNESCDSDPLKTDPGICGCGTADTDTDSDLTLDCLETCDNDPLKTAPGQCGCGVADTDTDGDTYADCVDLFPNDPSKWGDLCPSDPAKTEPLVCGCGVAETGDTDGDGTDDCLEACPADPLKTAAGTCGCGVADTDTDGDTYADCVDAFPTDPLKWAGTAVEIKISEARAAMEAQNLALAKTRFAEAYVLDATNKDALFGSAITEGIMLLENADIISLMTSADLYAPTVENIVYGVLDNTFEVFGGNTLYCGNDPANNGYTKLSTGSTAAPFSFPGSYVYYMIMTGPFSEISVDSVAGSTVATGPTTLNGMCGSNSSGWAGAVADGSVQTIGGMALENSYSLFSEQMGSLVDAGGITITTIGTATPAGTPAASLFIARSLSGATPEATDVVAELKGLLGKLPKNKTSVTTSVARAVASSLPANLKTVPEIQAILETTVMPVIDRMITRLRAVQGTGYTFRITPVMTGNAEVIDTILDDGEFYALDAALSGFKAVCNILTAYNLDVNYATFEGDPLGATLSNASFFTLKTGGAAKMTAALTNAREAVNKAELCYTTVFTEWGYAENSPGILTPNNTVSDNGLQWHDPNWPMDYTPADDLRTRSDFDAVQLGLVGQVTMNEVTAGGITTESVTNGTTTVVIDTYQSGWQDESFSTTFNATKFFTAPLDRTDLPTLGYNLPINALVSQDNKEPLYSLSPWVPSEIVFKTVIPDLTFNGILPLGMPGIDASTYHSSSVVLSQPFDTWNSRLITDGTSLFVREADWMNNLYHLWSVNQTTGQVTAYATVTGNNYVANGIGWLSSVAWHNGAWWGAGQYFDATMTNKTGVFLIGSTGLAENAIPVETLTYDCGQLTPCESWPEVGSLASDGTNLYLGLGIYDGMNYNAGIVKFAPATTTVIPATSSSWLMSVNNPWDQFSFGGGYLWMENVGEGDLVKVDPISGLVVRTWIGEDGTFLSNMIWRFDDSYVISSYVAP